MKGPGLLWAGEGEYQDIMKGPGSLWAGEGECQEIMIFLIQVFEQAKHVLQWAYTARGGQCVGRRPEACFSCM
eukprot:152406-Pelagomonas_calceolata.AAC.1